MLTGGDKVEANMDLPGQQRVRFLLKDRDRMPSLLVMTSCCTCV